MIGDVPPGQYVVRFTASGFLVREIPLDSVAPGTIRDLGTIELGIGEIDEGPVVLEKRPARQPRRAKPTTICAIARDPHEFNGKMVTVRGQVRLDFEDFELPASGCDTNVLPGIWLEYGRGPKQQPTTWCCGDLMPRDQLAMIQNAEFRKFHRSLTAMGKVRGCPSSKCYVYDVTATINGRFDFGRTEPCRNGSGNCCAAGFGHFGTFCGRIVIESVSAVEAVERR